MFSGIPISNGINYDRSDVIVLVIVNSRFIQRPQKAKFQGPAYSQVLIRNKIDRQQRVRSRESDRQAYSQTVLVVGF